MFLALAAGMIVAGYSYYQSCEIEFTQEYGKQLTSVADLKARDLSEWWHEKLSDADLLHNNPFISPMVREVLENPGDPNARQNLATWLSIYQVQEQYDRVYLLNTRGEILVSSPGTEEPVSARVLGIIPKVFDSGEVTTVDLFRNEHDQKVYLTLLIPVYRHETKDSPAGIIGLQVDPEEYLYPSLRQWPTDSQTAETLLVRRDNDQLLFLNRLRFRPDEPLTFRLSLNQTNRPEVMAVLGREGIVSGPDYQNLPAIANIREIPGTPWYLVARINTSEVYRPLQRIAAGLALIVLLIIAGTGGILFYTRQKGEWKYDRTRYAMNRALEESEEKFRILADNTYDWETWILPDGKTAYVSPSCERISGYSPDTFMSDPDFMDTIIHPEDRGVWDAHKREQDSPEAFSIDIRIIHRNGTTVWINHVCRPILTGSGENLGRRGSNRDISERIRMTEALAAGTRRFQDLVRFLPVSLFEMDIRGYFTFFNDHAYATYRYSPADLAAGLHFTEMVIPEEQVFAEKIAARILRGEVPGKGREYHCRRKDGSIVQTVIFTVPIVSEGGINGFRGVAIDLTETLIEKEKFTHVFSDSPIIMAISDLSSGRFRMINRAFETHLGYAGDEVIGKTSAELNVLVDDGQWETILESLRSRIPVRDYEVAVKHKDGKVLTLLLSGDIMAIEKDEIFFIQGVDITDLKETQKELAVKNEELAASFEELLVKDEELRDQYHTLMAREEELTQATRFLENLITYANVPIIIWNPDLTITRINHACENLIGRRQEEVIGKSLEILFPADNISFSRRLLETTHAGVRWDTVELEILHKDGTSRTVVWNSSTLYSPDGLTPVATISQGQDITHRRRLEEENEAAVLQIQKNLAQLSILNDGIRNPLTIIQNYVDRAGNPRLAETVAAEVGLIDEMVTQLDRRWIESEKILSMLRNNYQIDITRVGVTGEDQRGRGPETRSGSDTGLPVQRLLAEEIEAEMYTILDSIDAVVYVADIETYEILYLNRMGRNLYGEYAGKPCYQVIEGEAGGPCRFCLHHPLSEHDCMKGFQTSEHQNARNGRWYECRDRAVRWRNGRQVHLQIATDITERKAVETALRESEERFRSLFEKIPIALCFAGNDPPFVYYNDWFTRSFGYTAEDIPTMEEWWRLAHPDEEYREWAIRTWEEDARLATENGTDIAPREYSVTCRNGTRCTVVISGIKINQNYLGIFIDITDRKRVEEELRQSEASYRGLFNSMQQAIYILDRTGRFVDVNEGAVSMHGYQRDQFICRSFEFLSAEGMNSLADTMELIESAFSGTPQKHEFWAVHKNGEAFPEEIWFCKGTYFGEDIVIAIAADISDRKTAENILLKSEDRFTRINDALLHLGQSYQENIRILTSLCGQLLDADCVLYSKLEGDLLCVSGEWNSPPELEHSDSAEGHICSDLIKGDKDGPIVIRNLQKSRYAETDPNVRAFGLKTYIGHPVRYGGVNRGSLCAVYTWDCDISLEDLKIIGILSTAVAQEEERDEARLALQESEERFRLLLQDVPSLAIQGYLLDGTIVYWNRASERVYGYASEEVIGRNVLDLIIPTDMKAGFVQSLKLMERTGVAIPPTEQYLLHKNGSDVLVYSNHTIVNRPHKPPELYCFDVDLSERRQVEDALRNANRQINLMTSITRHDIKNRISLILICLDLTKGKNQDPWMNKFFHRVESVVMEIESLIEFTRIYEDLGTHAPQWQIPDRLLPRLFLPGSVTLTATVDDIEVYADLMLKKVFLNLLDNTTRHGEGATGIRVFSLRSDEELVIVWEDNGIGIPADQKELIFERGFGKNSGFGLFLVREILALTGISITETGIPGDGARFEIHVPRKAYRYVGEEQSESEEKY